MKCFDYHKKNKVSCNKKICRYWLDNKNNQNCCILSAKEDKFTLQDIGEIFDVTRMRICQIEKIAIKKIKEKVLSLI